MDPDRWRRVNEVFHRAVEASGSEREAIVRQGCAGDGELRDEVERLLRIDDEEARRDDFLSRLDAGASRATLPDPFIGRLLGVYRLTERLGAGGMGLVYRAVRSDGLYEQEVAIKLIRAEHATDWMVRHFAFERRALAALDHPAIARLFDGGTTEDGTPYFVMELVRGEPIDAYCRRKQLSLSERTRIFVEVCRAVQHAHRNLIVHCDLKPANILIDTEGRPRLLDFGIARSLGEGQFDASSSTRTLARVLTAPYASPEQLAGGPVTTSFDVYSLGVVLYELVCGARPFDIPTDSLAMWEKHVRLAPPIPPSARTDGVRPSAGGVRVGDLDRVVLMALRKEAERRYASAQEFADDLERILGGLPVRARPNSLGYLAASFVRRHRLAVTAAAGVIVALGTSYASAMRSEALAQREAVRAQMEADSFQSIAGFLMDGFLPAQPGDDPAWLERARARVLAQGDQVRRQYADEPHQRANMLDTLGQVCRRLDLAEDGRTLMEEAAAIRLAEYGDKSLEYALSLRSLGQLAYDDGDYAKAAEVLSQALAIHRAGGDAPHADVPALANDLAACLRNVGREGEAEALHREALAIRRTRDPRSLPVAESLNNLAALEMTHRNYSVAIELLSEALSIRSEILGDAHLLTSQTCSNLATVHGRAGQNEESLAMFGRSERGYRALGVDGEDGLAVVLANRSSVELALGRAEAAASSLEEALTLHRKRLRSDHPIIAKSLVRLARVQKALQRWDLAERAWIDALAIWRAGEGAPRDLADALGGFGAMLAENDAHERALPLLREAAEMYSAGNLNDELGHGRVRCALATCLEAQGDLRGARLECEDGLRRLDAHPEATEAERDRARARLESLRKAGAG